MLHHAVLLKNGVEHLQRTPRVDHEILGDDFKPADRRFAREDVLVMRDAQADADAVIREIIEAIRGHGREKSKRTRGRLFCHKFQPPARTRPGLGRAAGLATALALAGVLAFAAGISGLTSALAFTGVLAFAVVLARAHVIGQLAFADRALIGAARRGRVQPRRRAGHQPGEGDGRKHGFGGLKETWIFHLNTGLSCFRACFTDLLSPGVQPDKISHYPVRRRNLGFIPPIQQDSENHTRTGFPSLRVSQEKLLGRVLIRDGLLARVVGPNRGLNAAAALAAI